MNGSRCKPLQLVAAVSLAAMFGAGPAFAEKPSYREYEQSRRHVEYFEVSFDEDSLTVTVFDDGSTVSLTFALNQIRQDRASVVLNASATFDEKGLTFEGEQYRFDRISDSRVLADDGVVTITFFTHRDASGQTGRLRRGNRVEATGKIVIEEDEFVRGVVFTAGGDIEVYGEVNKDIISILGDVYVGPGAVARGDVVSASGRIDVASDASVYGEIYSEDDRHRRRYRFARREKALSVSGTFRYNRVDGATPYGGFRFDDRDSLLPSIWAMAGYGMASERWRHDIGLEQALLRTPSLLVGGSFYRRLASDDDWLLTDHENLAFTMLATEDFKDYYEAEGGVIYGKVRPFSTLDLDVRYRLEETKWLPAHSHLWSLFGGDKLFGKNFARVESPFRQKGIAEIDSTQNGTLAAQVDFDTRDEDDLFGESAWHLTANLEWSHPNLNSDFDYRRYTLVVRRYQKLHRYTMLMVRGMFGGSDGYLPMYKRFFLGGLGTLRGYRHKEYMGSRFWMANTEYRVGFPRTDLAASLFWDGAQLANDARLDSDVEVKHSLGVAVHFGDDLRIDVSKRLDRSFDDAPQIYVRLDHVF